MDTLNFQRLKEAVLLICQEAHGMTLGSIRLSKILFSVDRATFLTHFKPMIADAYIRGSQGPYLQELRDAIEELKQENKLQVTTEQVGKYPLTKYSVKGNPVLQLLTDAEQDMLKDFTYRICTDYTATEISEATHNAAWRMANDKEHIPLAAQLVCQLGAVSQSDIAWAEAQLHESCYAQ